MFKVAKSLPVTFAVDEIPGIALLRSTNPEAYKEIKSAARETDKALGLSRKSKPKKEKEQGKQKYQEEEPMSIEPATVVSTVVSRNTDFDSTTDYSVVERKRSCHRQSRQTLKPLFEDGISRNSETTNALLGQSPQCIICECKTLGCACTLKMAESE